MSFHSLIPSSLKMAKNLPLSSLGFEADSKYCKHLGLGHHSTHPTFVHISGSLHLFRVKLMHFCSCKRLVFTDSL